MGFLKILLRTTLGGLIVFGCVGVFQEQQMAKRFEADSVVLEDQLERAIKTDEKQVVLKAIREDDGGGNWLVQIPPGRTMGLSLLDRNGREIPLLNTLQKSDRQIGLLQIKFHADPVFAPAFRKIEVFAMDVETVSYTVETDSLIDDIGFLTEAVPKNMEPFEVLDGMRDVFRRRFNFPWNKSLFLDNNGAVILSKFSENEVPGKNPRHQELLLRAVIR